MAERERERLGLYHFEANADAGKELREGRAGKGKRSQGKGEHGGGIEEEWRKKELRCKTRKECISVD